MNSAELTKSKAESTVDDDASFKFPTTEQLISIARKGNQSAVGQLLDKHRNSLDRMVRMRLDRKIRNRVGPSDVVQDVLVEVNRRLPRYLNDPPMPFHLWVRQIARDRIIDAHRHHRGSAKRSVDREQALVRPRGYDQSSIHLASLLGGDGKEPVEAMIQKELASKSRKAT